MPVIYLAAPLLERKAKVGDKDCVALVKEYTILKGMSTYAWKQGEKVLGNKGVTTGTAIATFVKGKYLSHPTGNHAAFFLRQGPGGIWVIDQWKNDKDKPFITSRWIQSRGRNKDGSYPRASDNADAFSVIEINGSNK
jgi:hypothetical protein